MINNSCKLFLILCVISIFTVACGNGNKPVNSDSNTTENTLQPTTDIAQQKDFQEENENESNSKNQDTKVIEEVDYSKCFDGFEGGAVFFDMKKKKYYIYNKELCEKRASPCSTFKIPATLMGLHEKVLADQNSTMGYNGTIYKTQSWNRDMGLKDAFKVSCVWYFRKVIDQLGKEKVQKHLNELNFGNCDITQWKGSVLNTQSTINGFWLESSLQISPIEWVDVMSNIFEGDTSFTAKDLSMLRNVMLSENSPNIKIYGKTGTGKANAWYVGGFETKDDNYCFAIHLTSKSKETWGPKAQIIAFKIIDSQFEHFQHDKVDLHRK